jgi:hypothetical protein
MKQSSCIAIRPHLSKIFEEIKTQVEVIRQPNLSPLRVEIMVLNRKSLPSLIFHIARWSTNQSLCLAEKHVWRLTMKVIIMMLARNQILSFPSATCSQSEVSDQELTCQTSAKPCKSWVTLWAEVSGNALFYRSLPFHNVKVLSSIKA